LCYGTASEGSCCPILIARNARAINFLVHMSANILISWLKFEKQLMPHSSFVTVISQIFSFQLCRRTDKSRAAWISRLFSFVTIVQYFVRTNSSKNLPKEGLLPSPTRFTYRICSKFAVSYCSGDENPPRNISPEMILIWQTLVILSEFSKPTN
jgi:hypothetical protein